MTSVLPARYPSILPSLSSKLTTCIPSNTLSGKTSRCSLEHRQYAILIDNSHTISNRIMETTATTKEFPISHIFGRIPTNLKNQCLTRRIANLIGRHIKAQT